MKKLYKILLIIFLAEILILNIVPKTIANSLNTIVVAIIVFLGFLPLITLLILVGKDQQISKTKRCIAKVACAFIVFCFVGATIAKFF